MEAVIMKIEMSSTATAPSHDNHVVNLNNGHQTYLHGGHILRNVLVEGLNTATTTEFACCLFLVFFWMFCFEAVRFMQTKLSKHILYEERKRRLGKERENRLQYRLTSTLLHVIQVVMAYVIMLLVMSYNCWVFVAVVVGGTVAYSAFSVEQTSRVYQCELEPPEPRPAAV
ncbi:uncharacterized protein LOC100376380 [Saccoglossus kowalevskii]|uniref:Copper transport protein n=1 Tax=Saccoglossus kowalevskii TaxID=10224 RepID=A0ABM0GW04_SACKO|nr:PREDICTED: uncharacterized protein LOC100376380 [Saccoglossus kowalevskii]